MANPKGHHRPTLFRAEMAEEVKIWLKRQIDGYIRTDDGKKERLEVNLPTRAGLALHLGVSKDTIKKWMKDGDSAKEAFRLEAKKVFLEQERRLVSGGLSRKYSDSMAKFILSANHGYAPVNKTETKGEMDVKQTIKTFEIVDMKPEETNE